MPRRRTTRRRTTTVRRTRARTARPATRNYVKAVVKSATRADPHYYDYAYQPLAVQGYNAGVAAYKYQMLDMTEGDTQQSRNGKKIQLLSVYLNMSIYRDQNSTTHDRVRLCLVKVQNMDSITQANLGDLYNEVYDTTIAGMNTSLALQAPRKIRDGQYKNYTVLKTWNLDLGYGDTDKATRNIVYYHKFKRPLSIWYDTSTTSQPVRNNLVLIAVSDCLANFPILATVSRTIFLP